MHPDPVVAKRWNTEALSLLRLSIVPDNIFRRKGVILEALPQHFLEIPAI